MTDPAISPGPAAGPAERGGRNSADPAARRRWVWAVTVALIMHAGGILLFPVEPITRRDRPAFLPRVFWSSPESRDSVLPQMIDVLDPAPLFLPTRWNFAGFNRNPGGERPPGEIFQEDQARLPLTALAGTGRPPGLEAFPTAVASAAEAIRSFRWPPLNAMGRQDIAPVRLEPRSAMLEFRSMTTGEVVLATDLPPAVVPASNWPDWAPLELLLSIERSGNVAVPLVARTSGSEPADSFFRDYLARVFRPELRLPAGYYRVTVGP